MRDADNMCAEEGRADRVCAQEGRADSECAQEKARASRTVLTTAKPLFNFRDEVRPPREARQVSCRGTSLIRNSASLGIVLL